MQVPVTAVWSALATWFGWLSLLNLRFEMKEPVKLRAEPQFVSLPVYLASVALVFTWAVLWLPPKQDHLWMQLPCGLAEEETLHLGFLISPSYEIVVEQPQHMPPAMERQAEGPVICYKMIVIGIEQVTTIK